MRNNIILIITAWVTFFIQCTLVQYISVASIVPNLLIIFCVSIGLMRGSRCAMIIGFFIGLLADIFYGPVIGIYSVAYMCVGYFSGFASDVCYENDLKVPVLLSAIFDLGYNFVVYILLFLLRGRMGLLLYVRRIIIPEMVYTIILSIIIYPIYYTIHKKLMDPVKKESESIWEVK